MTGWSVTVPDLVGFVGVAILIGAYAGLQVGRINAEQPLYSAMNAVAALLIAFSLLYSFNAASMIIEVFWFAISLYGLFKSLRARAANRASHQSGDTSEE